MFSSFLTHLGFGLFLSLIQFLVALPWLLVLLAGSPRRWLGKSSTWWTMLGAVGGIGFFLALVLQFMRGTSNLQAFGKLYASVLQGQLTADLLVGLLAIGLLLWPKGGAVALAAFREGIRQPMFLLLLAFGLVFMILLPFIPYNTFGDDHIMAKELGLEFIMLLAIVFGALQASLSISEEIEGRTAVTLMSKPVSRRQFLLGKYLGILAACLLLTGTLGWTYGWVMDFKHWYDQVGRYDIETSKRTLFPADIDAWLQQHVPSDEERTFFQGTVFWGQDAGDGIPGLMLGFWPRHGHGGCRGLPGHPSAFRRQHHHLCRLFRARPSQSHPGAKHRLPQPAGAWWRNGRDPDAGLHGSGVQLDFARPAAVRSHVRLRRFHSAEPTPLVFHQGRLLRPSVHQYPVASGFDSVRGPRPGLK